MTHLPDVAVLVPTLNEAARLGESLASILAQDYAGGRLEILVIDGGSTDGTVEIASALARDDPRVRLIDNPRRVAAAALNIGVLCTTADIVIRMDAHGRAPPDYVSRVVFHLLGTGADHVGVLLDPVGEGLWGRAIARATRSRFGVGGSRYRCSQTSGWDEMGWSGGYWRQRLLDLGGFDESVGPNDDEELAFRIRRHGRGHYRTADVRVRYYCRSTPGALWRQYFRYGYFKPRVLIAHRLFRARHIVPPAFAMAMLLALLIGITAGIWIHALLLGSAYATGALGAAAIQARGESPAVAARVAAVFPVLHFAYGIGFLAGALRWSPAKVPAPWTERA